MGIQMTKKTKDIYTKSGNEVAQNDAVCQLLLPIGSIAQQYHVKAHDFVVCS
jgi:hypothetical protein